MKKIINFVSYFSIVPTGNYNIFWRVKKDPLGYLQTIMTDFGVLYGSICHSNPKQITNFLSVQIYILKNQAVNNLF